MRIIGGEARGRRIVAPEGTDTRPTADKTRESLFSILVREVPGAKVLDLFAGTGALGLEAMSRGAESAVLCDVSPKAQRAIEANIQTVMRGRGGARLIKGDYKTALEQLKGDKFDLVFIDPPYRLTEAYAYSVAFMLEHAMLTDDATVVCERAKEQTINWPRGARLYDSRTYRDTEIDFLTPEGT